MTISFIDTLPQETALKPVLISGTNSTDYSLKIFLKLGDENLIDRIFEVRYNVRCSPFKEAMLVENLLAVGFEEHFYLFNTITNESIIILKMNGYFCHLYYYKEAFYITDAYGLYCINKFGEILWSNTTLGIDGVIVMNITDNQIFGSGQCDPPDGWIDFLLDRATGK